MTPLSYDPLNYAAEFSTEMCPEGVVAVSGEKLRIFGVERLGEMFNQAALPLRYVKIGLAGCASELERFLFRHKGDENCGRGVSPTHRPKKLPLRCKEQYECVVLTLF